MKWERLLNKYPMRTMGICAVLVLCYSFVFLQTSSSSPMMAPTVQEAVDQSQYIVVGEYSGYSSDSHPIDYFYGPQASYRIVEHLKGEKLQGKIVIRYDFSDGSACIAPEDWAFSGQMMPKKASRWILFLQNSDNAGKVWNTYRGDYGRWPATQENLDQIRGLLKSP